MIFETLFQVNLLASMLRKAVGGKEEIIRRRVLHGVTGYGLYMYVTTLSVVGHTSVNEL